MKIQYLGFLPVFLVFILGTYGIITEKYSDSHKNSFLWVVFGGCALMIGIGIVVFGIMWGFS